MRPAGMSTSTGTTMLFGFFGRVSDAPQLRESLDLSSQRVRGIAQRVAGGPGQDFAVPSTDPSASPTLDLETEMANLADEQLRYEATAKLLEKTYAQLRLGLKSS
jgi:hypothetical protein